MAFVIPDNLPSSLLPIAWLIGRWEGTGVVDYPTIEIKRFHQVVDFHNDGRPFLEYQSHTWLLDDSCHDRKPLASEAGYWRVKPSDEEAPRIVEVEVVLAHPTGITEIYLGTAGEGKVEIATDWVARTETAKEYSAGKRLYGHVNGDLMWAFDMAAMGVPLTSHASAHLHRVPADDVSIDTTAGHPPQTLDVEDSTEV
ncbi:MAG: FABP family protein [Actinomycetales bacterium]